MLRKTCYLFQPNPKIMRFFTVCLKILLYIFLAYSFISCKPNKKTDYEFQDSTKIENVANLQEVKIDYENGVFFVSNNKGTQIDIYNSNNKDTTINFAEIKEPYLVKKLKARQFQK